MLHTGPFQAGTGLPLPPPEPTCCGGHGAQSLGGRGNSQARSPLESNGVWDREAVPNTSPARRGRHRVQTPRAHLSPKQTAGPSASWRASERAETQRPPRCPRPRAPLRTRVLCTYQGPGGPTGWGRGRAWPGTHRRRAAERPAAPPPPPVLPAAAAVAAILPAGLAGVAAVGLVAGGGPVPAAVVAPVAAAVPPVVHPPVRRSVIVAAVGRQIPVRCVCSGHAPGPTPGWAPPSSRPKGGA